MLKIYTDSNFLKADNRKKIFPLLFDMVYLPNEKTNSGFVLADSLSEADIAVFPVDIVSFLKADKDNFLQTWIENVSEYQIPIWVYAAGDLGLSLKKSNVFTFRFGGFNSKLDSSTFVMPCFVSDPYKNILKNDFLTLSKGEKPTIGFVGNANGSFLKRSKEFALHIKRNLVNLCSGNREDYHSFFPAPRRRYLLLNRMAKEEKIQSNFILRNKYRAGARNTNASKEQTTLEFFENIQNNLYTFCLRGNGNFSVRFYETLIMGRIPVLVDTDVRLPLADEIDWKSHCLIVSEKLIVEDLITFHASKTDFELQEMQRNNRKLILEKLNRIDYFIHLSSKIKFK
ncbi:exostosin domain-containing protein [Flavobacterium sp. RS13.1]|uniref:exostosin domain-containing protein n=1 Tax=Flavobacterium sp. RS13.1 TaxID=3400345 RepID=UPI003AAA8EB7